MTGAFQIGALSVSQGRLLAFGAAVATAVLLGWFLRFTAVGRAIRATSQNLDGALACGVDVDRVRMLSFALGTAVATAAGTLMSFIYNLNPQMGVLFTISAFAVVVVGGLGSYAGAVVGALVLGLAQSFTDYFAGAQLAEAAPYVLFIVVSLLLPSGLLGRRGA